MNACPRVRVRGEAYVIRLGSVFSPLTLVVFLYAPLLVLYALSSSTVFATDFGSRKTLSWTGFGYFALALLCFAAGAKAGDDTARAKPLVGYGHDMAWKLTPARRRSLAVLVEVALVVSIAAYVVWFTRGVVRAGGVTQLLEIWRSTPHRIKNEILTTVPGVTTLTQLAVAAIPLAVGFKLFRRGSVIPILVIVVFALALVRTVLYNERLALLELLLPVAFLLAARRTVTLPRVVAFALVFVVAVATFFAVTELRRTYAYTHDFSASRATTRFFGYYLTSVNNGMAIVDDYPAKTPFYSSGEMLWRLPVVGDLRVEHLPNVGTVSFRYADAFGVDPNRFWPRAFAAEDLNYEYNVFTTPGYLAADFGWAGLIGVFVLGVISGRLYRRCEESALHRALYAVWLVGLLEFMRTLYFTNTRLFPAYLVFIAAYLVVRPAWSRAPQLATRAAISRPPARVTGSQL